MTGGPARSEAEALDAGDRLAMYRDQFAGDRDVIYLAGNSLGRLPLLARERIDRALDTWAGSAVDGWDEWLDWPTRLGDRLAATVLGAQPGEVVVADSTTINLYKLGAAALLSAGSPRPAVLIAADEFPTDRFVLAGLPARVQLLASNPVEGPTPADVSEALAALGGDAALVCVSHVGYRNAAVADMVGITEVAHRAGALALWDLSHSAGCVPIDLDGAGVDLAVGCTYKYLCGGPGAPAFLYIRRSLQAALRQPIWGWFGQRDQFEMGPDYDPWPDARQYLAGTPPVLGLAGVDGALDVVAAAGVGAIRTKAFALGELAAVLVKAWLEPVGFGIGSPADAHRRGSHLALIHPDAARLQRLLHERRVVADLRRPDTIRLGMSPLTTRFVDVWDALDRLRALSY